MILMTLPKKLNDAEAAVDTCVNNIFYLFL